MTGTHISLTSYRVSNTVQPYVFPQDCLPSSRSKALHGSHHGDGAQPRKCLPSSLEKAVVEGGPGPLPWRCHLDITEPSCEMLR